MITNYAKVGLICWCALGMLSNSLASNVRYTDQEHRPGTRSLGRWFWLERRLRHSCQRWLQRQHRPRAGDVL